MDKPDEELRPDAVIPPEILADWITGPTILVGDGALRYRDRLASLLGDRAVFAPVSAHIPRASNGAMITLSALSSGAGVSPMNLLPIYLRLSQAELEHQIRHSSPAT